MIKVRGLSKSFNGTAVLDGIDLDINGICAPRTRT